MKGHNHIRKNTMREKAWKLMRIKGNYTISEIATLAEADAENIRHYHQILVAAGYARKVGTRHQEGRPGFDNVYRLVKNTGPKPPIQKDLRFLFDQNTGEYWAENPERVAESIAHPSPLAPLPGGEGGRRPGEGLTGKIKLGTGQRLLCPKKKVRHVD